MDANAALKFTSALNEFDRLWPGMGVQVVTMFMKLAQADLAGRPMSITEISEAVGMNLASGSRNISLLETRREDKDSPALDLVAVRPHPSQYRAKLVTLTPKGKALYKRVTALMEG